MCVMIIHNEFNYKDVQFPVKYTVYLSQAFNISASTIYIHMFQMFCGRRQHPLGLNFI